MTLISPVYNPFFWLSLLCIKSIHLQFSSIYINPFSIHSNILISALYILLEEISPGAFWTTPIWTGCSLGLLNTVISRCTFAFILKISFTSKVPLPGYHFLGVLPHFGTVYVPISSWENVLGRKNWRPYMSEYVFSLSYLFSKNLIKCRILDIKLFSFKLRDHFSFI